MTFFLRIKLCLLLCMAYNVPECTSEHLKLPKFPMGALPQAPLEYSQVSRAFYIVLVFALLFPLKVWEQTIL